ncbi:DUF4174 domain-containing protein [Methylobacterium sp. WL30]|uniref:DUF4174 domain-containing protein n=1 Tax=unclassified Methylobacterium TaxID=2615210 RepID=UPI0011CA69DF|nr:MULTISPECIES: DUF4174 domain-containing protein [unclassified Methylobacterium]TXM92266.1 DUF4174 domain-containing protein [Methylobacterium sp. WL116]TXN39141.1 DUF4174 domain-containing protein [Methylobacterium sp. WL93]TXN53207.1 DUF4174 domain-containing protein [Methylobacterium sp. WL119]TXN69229.1 DUF4174 domain-containing protein [Methylobacterium sp. WL30]
MRVGSGLTLAIASIALTGQAAAAQDPLARYRQASRVLVLSAPDADDRRLAEQRAAVEAARAGFGERDLVVVEAVGEGESAAAIRRQLRLPADAFHAVLVGKDGGVKITASDPIPVLRLFSTIDAMPMRRDEMRRQR